MKLLLYTLFLAPLAHGWTFRYTNSTSDTTILEETGSRNCTKIQLAKNKLFSWDPEGSNECISIYYDDNCETSGGYSCGFWKKTASHDFGSIDVSTSNKAASVSVITTTETATSTSSSSTTSTTGTPSAASTTSTPSASSGTGSTAATTDGASSGSTLSGGAIAGIVVGVVAGILAIAGLFFILRRRNRKNAVTANPQSDPSLQGPYGRQASVPETITTFGPSSTSTAQPVEKSADSAPRVFEMPSRSPPVELVSTPINEMDGQSGKGYFPPK
ncbi:uncharacterized protein N7484_002309 [Penicillium longicatenatum]|uniref:uncharacterized protein n=1 Tax=Penicillium longicatenatum TaxID=1561947 RepID=UPI002546F3C2|nr:uncharacterized protein N7484_002309 [Penicillium longicatenatum]KAJ5658660.1 hypothetical protein N7484_002309 [Penicillium longicatenatum]